MTKKQVVQRPKITRNDDGTYSAKFELEGVSKEELEEIYKKWKRLKNGMMKTLKWP